MWINYWNFVQILCFPGEQLKHDKNFKGPLTKRSCTDVFCLLIFIAFLCGWGFIAHFGKYDILCTFLACIFQN